MVQGGGGVRTSSSRSANIPALPEHTHTEVRIYTPAVKGETEHRAAREGRGMHYVPGWNLPFAVAVPRWNVFLMCASTAAFCCFH